MPAPNPAVVDVAAPPIARAAEWAAAYDGAKGPLIDLCQAVPGQAPSADFLQRFVERGASPQAARYGAILGDTDLRTAYAGHVAALYGAPLDIANVAITAGCNQAFFAAMLAVAGPGDAVVLPTPWYFNHQMTLRMLGIEARALPLRAQDGFRPRPDALEAVLDAKVRAVVLVTPNNPTGAVYSAAEIAAIHALCVERGIWLVLDETYRDFIAGQDGPPHDLLRGPQALDNVISLYSFSKSYAIPGHRVGALIAGRPLMAQIEKILDCVQICAPRPSQGALSEAIVALAGWRRAMAAEIEARAAVVRQRMGGGARWRLESIGAYFAYMRHPFEGRSSEWVAETLGRRFGLLVLPGTFFGPGQEAFLRVAFANVDQGTLIAVAERLEAIGPGIDEAHR